MNEHNDKQTGEHLNDSKHLSLEQLQKETGRDDKEEYAAELAAPYGAAVQAPVEANSPVRTAEAQEEQMQGQSRWIGYTALVLGLLSLFVFPALFGSAAALLGVITYFQGNRALGIWSIVLGLISLAGYFLLVPLYA